MLLPGNGESDAGIWVNKFLSRSGERVAACLTRLATIVRRPSQFRCSVFASMLLHSILKFLHNSCETRRDDDALWKEDDHLSLKELYREGSNRPRKVSKEFKRIVSEQVAAVPSLRNAQQLLAGRLLLLKGQRTSKFKTKGVGKKCKGLQSACGRTFCQDNMLGYRATCAMQLGQWRIGHVGYDGTRVGKRELNFYMFEDILKKKSCWLTPKVIVILFFGVFL